MLKSISTTLFNIHQSIAGNNVNDNSNFQVYD